MMCVVFLSSSMPSAKLTQYRYNKKSTLATFSSFGSFDSGTNSSTDSDNNEQEVSDDEYDGGNNRLRGLSTVSTSSVAKVTTAFFRVILVCSGIILAISIHFFKMMMRLLGEGCLTQVITVLEASTVCFSVLVSIFVRQFAILVASFLLFAAAYSAKRKWDKWQEEEKQQQGTSVDDQENNAAAVPSAAADEYVKMDEAGAENTPKPGATKTGRMWFQNFFVEVEKMRY